VKIGFKLKLLISWTLYRANSTVCHVEQVAELGDLSAGGGCGKPRGFGPLAFGLQNIPFQRDTL